MLASWIKALIQFKYVSSDRIPFHAASHMPTLCITDLWEILEVPFPLDEAIFSPIYLRGNAIPNLFVANFEL